MKRSRVALAALAVAALAAVATVATASEHGGRGERGERGEGEEREGRGEGRAARARAAPADPEALALYRKECGACHVAYPPHLLSADAHRQLMVSLDRHFGSNAELDAGVRDRIERYLVASAGDGGAAGTRITEASWFLRKHRRIDARVTSRPSVRSLANCAACHAGASDWDFDDDRVRIPAS